MHGVPKCLVFEGLLTSGHTGGMQLTEKVCLRRMWLLAYLEQWREQGENWEAQIEWLHVHVHAGKFLGRKRAGSEGRVMLGAGLWCSWAVCG